MDDPSLSIWERDGARATVAGLVRDSGRIRGIELGRRLDRLTDEQRRLVYRWVVEAAMTGLDRRGTP